MSVGPEIYIPLSVVMFLEFAIWGAWAPVLAARLLGPLKMTGKQTGWIYATLPLACMISPFVAGQLADKYFDAKWILVGAHLVGAILMFVAGRTGKFAPLFLVMLGYATLPLVNAELFAHVSDTSTQSLVFIWAPVSWALIGYFLSGWRMMRKGEGDGSDCMKLAALLSLLMAVGCLFLPATAPAQTGGSPLVAALGKLG